MPVLQESQIRIHTEDTAPTKSEAMREAAEILEAAGAVTADYYPAMLEREKSVSTYMGNFLAIPHGTNEAKDAIMASALSFIRYATPIDWDGNPVRFVVGIAGVNNEHLDILSKIAIVFSDEDEVQKLPDAAGHRRDPVDPRRGQRVTHQHRRPLRRRQHRPRLRRAPAPRGRVRGRVRRRRRRAHRRARRSRLVHRARGRGRRPGPRGHELPRAEQRARTRTAWSPRSRPPRSSRAPSARTSCGSSPRSSRARSSPATRHAAPIAVMACENAIERDRPAARVHRRRSARRTAATPPWPRPSSRTPPSTASCPAQARGRRTRRDRRDLLRVGHRPHAVRWERARDPRRALRRRSRAVDRAQALHRQHRARHRRVPRLPRRGRQDLRRHRDARRALRASRPCSPRRATC